MANRGDKINAPVVVFSLTLFTSAFLLFSIQPLVAKSLVLLLGGTPMVWNTSVAFAWLLDPAGYGTIVVGSRRSLAPRLPWLLLAAKNSVLWTDDHSNILAVLGKGHR